MLFKKIMVLISIALVFTSTSILANIGTELVHTKDSSKVRVNEIRSDILKWINDEGAKGLIFSKDLAYDEYISNMTDLLQPNKVIITFTNEKVNQGNVEKTCKNFTHEDKTEKHILCNISRFGKTNNSDQYKLIHHEYAGLAGIEENEGAASDYHLSSQITDFLTHETILKLSINKTLKKQCTLFVKEEDEYYLNHHEMFESFKIKNYVITSKEEAKYSVDKFFFSCASRSVASPYINEQGLILYYCDDMYVDLILKNNISGERLGYVGHYLKSAESRPTTGNVLSDLMNNMPECK